MNEVMTIWDYINTPNLATYWLENNQDRPPTLGETLFGTDKKMGLDLSFIKGAQGVPKVLKFSAFDVEAVPRPRIKINALSMDMPFFKESMYIEEALRQEILMLLQTRNQSYIDTVMRRVFNDTEQLVESAAVSRERMRFQLLTTGTITAESNGQIITYDYQQPDENFVVSSAAWSDFAQADAIADIRGIQEYNRVNFGAEVTKVILNTVTFNKLLQQDAIKNSIFYINALAQGTGQLTDAQLRQYFSAALGVTFVIYDKRYQDDAGVVQKYVPDDTVVVMPEGQVGTMWFGTTPEEADLLSGAAHADTRIIDTGVAICAYKQIDPVNSIVKVSQLCLPSYELGNQVYVLDVSDDATRP